MVRQFFRANPRLSPKDKAANAQKNFGHADVPCHILNKYKNISYVLEDNSENYLLLKVKNLDSNQEGKKGSSDYCLFLKSENHGSNREGKKDSSDYCPF